MNNAIGIDSTGTWTPAQYAIDTSWDYDATEWVYAQDESDDHHDDTGWDAALRRAFVALYRREPDAEDERAGLWSLCCAATPNCGTRPE